MILQNCFQLLPGYICNPGVDKSYPPHSQINLLHNLKLTVTSIQLISQLSLYIKMWARSKDQIQILPYDSNWIILQIKKPLSDTECNFHTPSPPKKHTHLASIMIAGDSLFQILKSSTANYNIF